MASQSRIQVTHPLVSLVLGVCNQKINTSIKKTTARTEPEVTRGAQWGGKRAAEYTDHLPATQQHRNPGLRWAPPHQKLPPTYWNFKGLLRIIQHLDLDGHEFSWRRGGRLLSMFQRTDPRILRGPQSRSWSWPLLYLSHDESRLQTVSTRSRERRKIHQKRRCTETTSVTFVLSALHCRNPPLAPPETHEGRSAPHHHPGAAITCWGFSSFKNNVTFSHARHANIWAYFILLHIFT